MGVWARGWRVGDRSASQLMSKVGGQRLSAGRSVPFRVVLLHTFLSS